jgi:uncharacterized alpha-E superfamily protein
MLNYGHSTFNIQHSTFSIMLSRVADNLYWMSRYLERAEHTARLLGVMLNQMLDIEPQAVRPRWLRMLAALRLAAPPDEPIEPYALTRWLCFDPLHQGSILAYIGAARENARQVREQISSEMWEQLNSLYLRTRGSTMEQVWRDGPNEFMQMVKEGAHLFQGITDGTMTHGEGWRFIQLGRGIERSQATAMLLDVHFKPFLEEGGQNLEYGEWVALLKSCTAFEAYCKVYTAEMKPEAIAEFLLLNAHFPRSLRFCADRIQHSLQAISQHTGSRAAGKAERLAGRLRASLDYVQVEEVMAENMHAYLESINNQCNAIHNAIYQAYISYPVENALA